jgi:hypothetical protein
MNMGGKKMGIELDDILGFNFFQYGSPYIGECGGMHFRLARNPLENVVFNHDPHKNDEALFDVTIWRGPYNYDKTRQKKTTAQFPFTEDGRLAAVQWLNERYDERVDYWADGIPLFPKYKIDPDETDTVEVDENLSDDTN